MNLIDKLIQKLNRCGLGYILADRDSNQEKEKDNYPPFDPEIFDKFMKDWHEEMDKE